MVASAFIRERNRLIERHLHVVQIVAKEFYVRLHGHVDLDTLMSDGYLGLLAAAGRFSASKGVRFSTYAKHRVRGAMLDARRDRDWVPRLQREREKSGECSRGAQVLSLASTDGSGIPLSDRLAGVPAAASPDDARDALADMLCGLPARARRIMMMRYADDLTMREIGEVFGISPSRVSQIHAGALLQLRRGMSG